MRINLLDELSKKKAFTIEDAEQISHANKDVLKVILSRKDKNRYLSWYIDINTFKDLQNLIKEVGRIIIRENWITIYDDYIE